MADAIRPLIKNVAEVRKRLPKGNTVQLKSTGSQAIALRGLVDGYFKGARIEAAIASGDCDELYTLDRVFQDILELTHRSTRASRYQILLNEARGLLVRLDSLASVAVSAPAETKHSAADAAVIKTLQSICPSAALSYAQALVDLEQSHRHSWRGPATDLRECLRETLDFLAPDADVMATPGYKPDGELKAPTMKQKVRFIMRRRGKGDAVAGTTEQAATSVEAVLGTFVRSVYTRSNVSTHTPTDRQEVVRVLNLVRVCLSELLEI